jgi:CubicO group peptidase (beta-lactamase class C family)/virulence-associated protein VagC
MMDWFVMTPRLESLDLGLHETEDQRAGGALVMRLMWPFLCVFVVALGPVPLAPCSALGDEIDDLVSARMQKKKIPGLALAVVEEGKVVKAKGYGLANVELNVPATEATIFQSGSVGKQFTATLVMMLVEDGKIGLADPISRYFDHVPETWKGITVRHLLSHTAGISNRLYEQIDMRKDYSDGELVDKIAAIPPDFAPGEKWNYSNPGYVLLGILVKKATGRFYGDLLRERIFGPLGMATARIINEADIIPNRSAGYRLVKGELKNQEWVSPTLNTTADGSLYLTIQDMIKWDAALDTERLIKKSSLQQMWTPVKLNDGKTHPYGFGWGLAEVGGRKLIEHGGAWQGFTTHIARYVDDKLTVIVLTNAAHGDPTWIAHQVAGLRKPALRPSERKAIHVDPKILDDYLGSYELSPEMKLEVTRDGDKLMLQPTGQPKLVLFAESPKDFFLEEPDVQITFIKDEKGKTTKLILHQGGDRAAKKVN